MIKFNMLPEEEAAIDAWLDGHNKTCPYYDDGTKISPPGGAIGGRLTYCFSPTGVGVVVEIRCACGSRSNVTDYSKW